MLRGGSAASIATFAALLSHVHGGGEMPGAPGIVAPWILSLAVCTLLAGRRLSLVRLTLAVALSQFLFHALFVLGVSPTTSLTASAGAATMHHMSGHTAMSAMPDPTMSAMHADPGMWSWHLIAALVTTAALYRGERAARRLLRLADQARAWLQAALARAVPALGTLARTGRLAVSPAAPQAAVDRQFLTAVGRRGPPTLRTV